MGGLLKLLAQVHWGQTKRSNDVHPSLPRSAKYDDEWVQRHAMGPNPLWLMEALCERVTLAEGMRVLDLGCGKAVTSVFLAKEFGVQVWAADLWIAADENRALAEEAGVADRVFPVRCDARALPFADGYFDAIVSVDAYHYFGTEDFYLAYIARFLAPNGRLAMASPGFRRELGADLPAGLKEAYSTGLYSLHTVEWWRGHWAKTGLVDVISAEEIPESADIWREDAEREPEDRAIVEGEGGDLLNFVRVVAARTSLDPRSVVTGYDLPLG